MEVYDEAGRDGSPATGGVTRSAVKGETFRDQLMAATPRVFVTQVISGVCVAVFAAMVVSGVSPTQPDIPSLLAWGANYGPYVANDHQEWRLFTNLFVHIGIIHLALNLWCLLSAAPLVERLYGNVGFAVIYLLSGLGGSIASLGWHPMLSSAGASGAIFGVYGALGAFLVAHRHVIPVSILKPLNASTLIFVGYNLVVGAMDRRIDSAAHLGGLVTGFVAGFLIGRPWPVSAGRRAIVRRLVLGGAVALGLFAGYQHDRGKIQRDPDLSHVSQANERAGVALNRFLTESRAPMEDYDRIVRESDRVIEQLRQPNPPPPALPLDRAALVKTLGDLSARADADRGRLDRVPVEGQELAGLRQEVSRAFASLSLALQALRRGIETDEASHLTGPGGFAEQRKRSNDHSAAYSSALQEYARKHHLESGR